jgi:hypothetical protein
LLDEASVTIILLDAATIYEEEREELQLQIAP